MRGPLEVCVDTAGRQLRLTSKVTDLSFSKVAPGGHEQLACTIWVNPADVTDLGAADLIYVQDARTGETVWDGFLNNPGHVASPTGVGLSITAVGSMVLASDRAEVMVYRDGDLGNWEPNTIGGKASTATADSSGAFPSDAGSRSGDPGLLLGFQKGVVSSGSRTGLSYRHFRDSLQPFGAMTFFRDDGMANTNFHPVITTAPATVDIYRESMVSLGSSVVYSTVPGAAEPEHGDVLWQLVCVATNTVAGDNVWSCLGEVVMIGFRLFARAGTFGQSTFPLRPYQIVEDVLVRLLGACDQTAALLEISQNVTGIYMIDQLAYLEATTASGVFDDLMGVADQFWGIGARRNNGKYRFWWRDWPPLGFSASGTYVLTDADDITLPGSDNALCNRVAVEWVSASGYTHNSVFTADVPALGTRIVDAEKVTLPDGRGSAANARQVGAQVLANANAQVLAGTAVVTRPLQNRTTGNLDYPWRIEPGCIAHLQSLGVDMRVTAVAYDDGDCSATLTLNSPFKSTDTVLNTLKKNRR